jgi:hypothetical protein
LLGSAYLAIVPHVVFGRRTIARIPATVGIVVGSIEAVLSLPVLWYAWKVYLSIAGRKVHRSIIAIRKER